MKHEGFTPGPWRFVSGSQRVGSGTWGCIADIAGTVTDPAMRAANGRLIADAPALAARVERLETLLARVVANDMEGCALNGTKVHAHPRIKAVFAEIRAALSDKL